jgi:integrase/recombinase XerD
LPVAEPYLFRLVRRLAGKARIPAADHISPHSLRHTAITEALEATHDLRKAQDLAGHADPRTTRLYDLRRGQLDGHAAYVLATRYGSSRD